jgi:uncharacterized protein (TIRG00374 family)
VRRVLYWAVPVVVLYLVFQRIDLEALRASVIGTNPWLLAVGIGLVPSATLIGALRWRFLLGQYHGRPVPLQFVLKHYWIGLALGVFAPGSISWDVYRVVASGRCFGHYGANVAVILVEKFMALVTCLSLVLALYPLLPIERSPEMEGVLRAAVPLFFVCLILVAIMAFALRNRVLTEWVGRIEVRLGRVIDRLAARFHAASQGDGAREVPLRLLMEPLVTPGKVVPVLGLSVGVQLANAATSQIFFRALGYDLPFLANLFVAPVLMFVFLLPISFGSLGIREASYIIIYGMFGVPPETALLVSFFNLSGMLLNNLIGGVVMLLSNVRVPRSGEIATQDDEESDMEDGHTVSGKETVSGP